MKPVCSGIKISILAVASLSDLPCLEIFSDPR